MPGRRAPEPLTFAMPGQGRFVARAQGAEVERVAVGRFPDGELRVEVPAHVHGRHCIAVGSISPPPGRVERFTLVVHALRRAGARRVSALLPYLAYARQDRAEPTASLGLAWAGALLRAVGVHDVMAVDVHSDAASEVLGLPVRSLSPAPLLAAALPAAWREEATFVAPDEGAIDRCLALKQAAGSDGPVVWLRKRRTAAGVEHLGTVGTPGRRALVVDDIVDTGGTLVSCCRELRRLGVERLGVLASHGIFTGDAARALFDLGVERLWITDTVLARTRPSRAEVVAVAPLLAPVLRGAAT